VEQFRTNPYVGIVQGLRQPYKVANGTPCSHTLVPSFERAKPAVAIVGDDAADNKDYIIVYRAAFIKRRLFNEDICSSDSGDGAR
jgi:hypothetical protein